MTKRNAAQRKSKTHFEQLPLSEVLTKIGERNDGSIGSRSPTDGDTKPCPQCRHALVFNSRYPVLRVAAMCLSSTAAPDHIHYEPAWACRNGACDYRELLGDM